MQVKIHLIGVNIGQEKYIQEFNVHMLDVALQAIISYMINLRTHRTNSDRCIDSNGLYSTQRTTHIGRPSLFEMSHECFALAMDDPVSMYL